MAEPTTVNTRAVTETVSVIDIAGDVVPSTDDLLLEAFAKCEPAQVVVLNFTDLAYMNSGGIGLLVTMLVRAQRSGQTLRAYGLSDHYRHIFQLTRLDDTIELHDSEAAAIATVEP
jgi:anti-sigma B factor antagonist